MRREDLALGSTAGDVQAGGRCLSSSEGDAGPGPVGAGSLAAEDVDSACGGGDGSCDAGDGEASDGDTGGWLARWGAVLVILLDDDTVLGDVGEDDILVCDI